MPPNEEEAKAKLIKLKEKGQSEADGAADVLHNRVNNARDVVKDKVDGAESVLDDVREDASHVQQDVAGKITHYEEVADQKAGEVIHMVKSSASNAQIAFDDSLSAASGAVKEGAAQARFQYSRAYHRSQVPVICLCSTILLLQHEQSAAISQKD